MTALVIPSPEKSYEHTFRGYSAPVTVITSSARRLAGDDFDGDPELHVGMELDRDLVGAERLDGLVEVQAAPVQGDASLGRHRVHHVSRRHGPEKASLRTGPRRNSDHGRHELAGDGLCRLPVDRKSTRLN